MPTTDRLELTYGEIHQLDLVGLEVRLAGSDKPINTVSDLISSSNGLLEIQLHNVKTVLVPFVEAILPEVRLEEGWLLLTPPSGLLELLASLINNRGTGKVKDSESEQPKRRRTGNGNAQGHTTSNSLVAKRRE